MCVRQEATVTDYDKQGDHDNKRREAADLEITDDKNCKAGWYPHGAQLTLPHGHQPETALALRKGHGVHIL